MIWKYEDVDYRKVLLLIFIWYISDKFWHYWLVLKTILGSLSAENGKKIFSDYQHLLHMYLKNSQILFLKRKWIVNMWWYGKVKVLNTHTLTFALEINKNWCSTYVLQKSWMYMLIVEDNCEDQLESRWLLFQLRQITNKSKLFSVQGASHILVRWLREKKSDIRWNVWI